MEDSLVRNAIVLFALAACGESGRESSPRGPELEERPVRKEVVRRAEATDHESRSTGEARRPDDEQDESHAPLGAGISISDVRRVGDVLEAKAHERGESGGLSLALCRRLELASLVTRCRSLGRSGRLLDQTQFELRDPTEGRGVIQHWDEAAFEVSLRSLDTFTADFGTLVIANHAQRLVFVGGEQLSPAERERVRATVESFGKSR